MKQVNHAEKTREQLIGELAQAHQQIVELEQLVTDEKATEQVIREAREYAESIIATVREPLLVLDADLRVVSANRSFYQAFGVKPEETQGRFIYDLGDQQWDIPRLRELLEEILPGNTFFQDFVVDHHFPTIGRRIMLFNARRLYNETKKTRLILLAIQDITENKRAEEKLSVSELRYRRLFETAQGGILILNADTGQIVDVNPFLINMLGYSRKELLGRKLWDIGPFENAEESQKAFLKLQSRGYVRCENLPLETKDGHPIPVEFVSNVYDVDHEKVIQCNIRSISERKQAEMELQQSEEKLRLMFESLAEGIIVTDLDGKIVQINEAAVRMHGYDSRQELISQSVFELITKKDYVNVMENLNKTLKEGYVTSIEYTLLRKDRSEFPDELSISILKNASGIPVGFIAITEDITERKRMKELLKEEGEKYRVLVTDAADAILLADGDGNILEANKKAEKLLGYTIEELLHMNIAQIHPEEELERTLAVFREIAEKDSGFLSDGLVLRKDGKTVPVDIASTTIKYADKRIYQGIFRDITERKRMEEQLIVTDRLASIGELASGIAHELNNPLTSIIGFSELLLEKDVPDNIKEDLKTINKEAQRTAGVIRNLLTFVRKHEMSREPVDINDTIKTVLVLRAYEENINNIRVNTRFAQDLPEVMVDGFQLQQVFLNIIINAEFFMIEAHGRGTLTITTERAGDIIRASVADDGPGIAKENTGHIFDPFFTTKEVGKGTGLGLSICHGIIAAHGGRIYAESELGKGATFIMELPISQ